MAQPINDESAMTRPEDAETRFRQWKDKDPFPHIFPALLNSADIHDYIETTGLVYPYDSGAIKSSSYEAKIGDFAYFWGEGRERKSIRLDKNSSIELKPNSLVFFETKEKFRLPSYMAIRFNLKITNVHRGLLLGTGPLVDPGFEGKLLIPIHNLTENTYCFKGDAGFIWVEFTKISQNAIWDQSYKKLPAQRGKYIPFRKDKIDQTSSQYFEKANNGNSIRNAIPATTLEIRNRANVAEKQAKEAKESANAADKKIRKLAGLFSIVGAVAIVAAALGVVFGVVPIVTDSTNLSKDISLTVSEFRKEYRDNLATELHLQTKIENLQEQIGALQNELSQFKALQEIPNSSRQ